jgi:hypothetical protein
MSLLFLKMKRQFFGSKLLYNKIKQKSDEIKYTQHFSRVLMLKNNINCIIYNFFEIVGDPNQKI